MSLLEIFGQHIHCLTHNLNILHHGIISADVGFEIIIGKALY